MIPLASYFITKDFINFSIGGVELKVVDELSKYFAVKFVSKPSSPGYWIFHALDMIRDNKSDMALCATWLAIDLYTEFDLSEYLDAECGTLLVPTPALVSSALYAFFPFTLSVWLSVLICLMGTAMLVVGFTRCQHFECSSHIPLKEHLGKPLLELVNLATNHGMHRFPSFTPTRITLIR